MSQDIKKCKYTLLTLKADIVPDYIMMSDNNRIYIEKEFKQNIVQYYEYRLECLQREYEKINIVGIKE